MGQHGGPQPVCVARALHVSYMCALDTHREVLTQIVQVPGHKAQARGLPAHVSYRCIHDAHSSVQHQNAGPAGPGEVGGSYTYGQHRRNQ